MSNYDPDTQLVKELALINCRELGGMPLAGGKTFRKGIFLRSGSPEWLNDEQIREVKDYGVKTVIDLRGIEELKGTGNPFAEDPDVKFYILRGEREDEIRALSDRLTAEHDPKKRAELLKLQMELIKKNRPDTD